MSKQTRDDRAERLLNDMPKLTTRLESARQAWSTEWTPSRATIRELREKLDDLETQVARLQKTLSVA